MKARVSVIAPTNVIQVGTKTKSRKKSAKARSPVKAALVYEEETHVAQGPSEEVERTINISDNVGQVTYVETAPRQSLNSKLIEERMAELEAHENKFQTMMA